MYSANTAASSGVSTTSQAPSLENGTSLIKPSTHSFVKNNETLHLVFPQSSDNLMHPAHMISGLRYSAIFSSALRAVFARPKLVRSYALSTIA